jgi:hypothetical protein
LARQFAITSIETTLQASSFCYIHLIVFSFVVNVAAAIVLTVFSLVIPFKAVVEQIDAGFIFCFSIKIVDIGDYFVLVFLVVLAKKGWGRGWRGYIGVRDRVVAILA